MESIQLRPARRLTGFWLMKHTFYCPECGYEVIRRVRMYTRKPTPAIKREDFHPYRSHCRS